MLCSPLFEQTLTSRSIVCGYLFFGTFGVAFFAFSFFTNMVCTSEYVTDFITSSLKSASSTPFPQVIIMAKVLKSGGGNVQDHWNWGSRALFNFVRYRRVVEAVVQSAAIYSVASISLVVTIFLSPNIGYSACLCVFPPLIVRVSLSSARTRISLLTILV